MNPHNTTHTVTHWDREEALSRIDGLSLDAAHETAAANSSIIGSCTVDADGLDYREVWTAGYLDRKGPFAHVTLVREWRNTP